MRTAVATVCLLLAACIAAPSHAAPDTTKTNRKPGSTVVRKKPAVVKPTWERCYAMSIERGFDHDIEEWWQAIDDCQQGKIPL